MTKPLETGTMAADNLAIWSKVSRVDPKATREFNIGDRVMTAVNPTYIDRMATEIFGLFGTHWGVDIVQENFDKGAPLMQTVKDGNITRKEIISDGDGGFLCELHHTVLIKLWYSVDGERGEVLAYGCTKYLWANDYGIKSDGEARKKSMTDAKKKALSQLGFAADVFEGKFDDIDYVSEAHAEFSLKRAEESDVKASDTVNELIQSTEENVKTIQTSATPHEVNGILKVVMRKIDANIAVYQGKADMVTVNRLETLKKAVSREAEKRKADLEKKKQLAEQKRATKDAEKK